MTKEPECECRILKQEARDCLTDIFKGWKSKSPQGPCIDEADVCALVDKRVNGVLTDITDIYWETVGDTAAPAQVCNPP
jgi:hypothetical protein